MRDNNLVITTNDNSLKAWCTWQNMTHNRIVCFRECHLLLENDEKLLRNFILTQRGSKGENQLYVELCVGLKRLQKKFRNQKKRPLKIFIKKETKHHNRGKNSRTYETKQRSKDSKRFTFALVKEDRSQNLGICICWSNFSVLFIFRQIALLLTYQNIIEILKAMGMRFIKHLLWCLAKAQWILVS